MHPQTWTNVMDVSSQLDRATKPPRLACTCTVVGIGIRARGRRPGRDRRQRVDPRRAGVCAGQFCRENRVCARLRGVENAARSAAHRALAGALVAVLDQHRGDRKVGGEIRVDFARTGRPIYLTVGRAAPGSPTAPGAAGTSRRGTGEQHHQRRRTAIGSRQSRPVFDHLVNPAVQRHVPRHDSDLLRERPPGSSPPSPRKWSVRRCRRPQAEPPLNE